MDTTIPTVGDFKLAAGEILVYYFGASLWVFPWTKLIGYYFSVDLEVKICHRWWRMIQPFISLVNSYFIINAFIGVKSDFLSFSTGVSDANGHCCLRREWYSHKSIFIFNHKRVLIPYFTCKLEGVLLPSSDLETYLSSARGNGVPPYIYKADLHYVPTNLCCLLCDHLHN